MTCSALRGKRFVEKVLDTGKKVDSPSARQENQNLYSQKTLLGIVTVFTINMLVFTSYSGIFYPNTEKQIMIVDKSDIKSTEFQIRGMTCAGCEKPVRHEVNKLDIILTSKVSYKNENAIIKFVKT